MMRPSPSAEEQPGPPPRPRSGLCGGLLEIGSKFQALTKALVLHPLWTYFSAFVTLLHMMAIFEYDPCILVRGSFLSMVDIVFCAFFCTETSLFIVALGPREYIRSHWHKLDALILFSDLLGFPLMIANVDFSVVQDPLRPLRLCGRIPFLRRYLKTIGSALPTFGRVTVIFMSTIFICSVMSVKLWKGQLHNRCFLSDNSKSFLTLNNISANPFYANPKAKVFLCSTSEQRGQQCGELPSVANPHQICRPDNHTHPALTWTNLSLLPPDLLTNQSCVDLTHLYNTCKRGPETPYRGVVSFDDIGHALIAIFQVTTLEGWSEIMYFVMDAYSFWSFVFFILVTLIGSFLMLNLVVVVIASHFSGCMGQLQGQPGDPTSALLTYAFRLLTFVYGWVQDRLQDLLLQHGHVLENPFFLWCSAVWRKTKDVSVWIMETDFFKTLMGINVGFSILVLAVEHHQQPNWLTKVEYIARTVGYVLFMVELLLRLCVMSYRYFLDMLYVLDFIMVITSTLEMILPFSGDLKYLFRSFRVLRLLSIIRLLPYLRKQLVVLGKTISQSIPLLLMIVQFVIVFSLLGMHLFGCKFKFLVENGMWRKNFDHLKWAMVTVFQILTHEDWNYVMYNGMVGISPWAALYFTVLIFLGKNLFLNILVSIVVHNFQVLQSRSPNRNNAQGNEANLLEPNQAHAGGFFRGFDIQWFLTRMPNWLQRRLDHSLFMFAPENRFRRLCKAIASSRYFEIYTLVLIGMSCIVLAMERPSLSPESTERIVLTYLDFLFTGLFLLELILKVVSLGLVLGSDAYAQCWWNVLDGVLVMMSLIDVIVTLADSSHDSEKSMLGIFKVLRLLRTMRPLRMLKHVPQLRHAINTLLAAIKPVLNVVSLSLIIMFMFGVMGVQLWKGAFSNCVDNEAHDVRIDNITSEASCLQNGYYWERRTFNFDNIFQALLTLFVMYSKDGWVNIMYDAIDAVGPDIQPVTEYNPWRSLYFIFFMTFSYQLLDMFIGTILDAWFEQAQGQVPNQGNADARVTIRIPSNRLRFARYIVHCEWIVTLVCLGDLFLMSAEHYQQPKALELTMEIGFYLVTLCFFLLLLFKIWVLRSGVFRDKWNCLDVALLLLCVVDIIMTTPPLSHKLSVDIHMWKCLRVLSIAQVMKVIKHHTLIRTIGKTLKKCGSLGLLLIFFFYIYAVLSLELFGGLECVAENPCQGISRYANFGDFFSALLVLFKISTGDNWSGILMDTMRPCRPQEHHCFDYFIWAAPMVFITFVVLVQFILFNLIVAAVMQALEESRSQGPEPPLQVGPLNQNELDPPAEADQQDRLRPDPPAEENQQDRLRPDPPAEANQQNGLRPDPPAEENQQDRLRPDPPAEENQQDRLRPDPPAEENQQDQLRPDPPAEENQQDRLRPDPPAEENQQDRLRPDPPAEENQQDQLRPDPPAEENQQDRLRPEPPAEENQQDRLRPDPPAEENQQDRLRPEPPAEENQQDRLRPDPPAEENQQDQLRPDPPAEENQQDRLRPDPPAEENQQDRLRPDPPAEENQQDQLRPDPPAEENQQDRLRPDPPAEENQQDRLRPEPPAEENQQDRLRPDPPAEENQQDRLRPEPPAEENQQDRLRPDPPAEENQQDRPKPDGSAHRARLFYSYNIHE